MKYHEFNPVIYSEFLEQALERYDFARCQRPDGSYYGTGGQCRKGVEVAARETDSQIKARREKLKEEAKALRKEGFALMGSGNQSEGLKKMNKALEIEQSLPKTGAEKKKEDKARKAERADSKMKREQEPRSAKAPPPVQVSEKAKAAVLTYTSDNPKPPPYVEMNKCARGRKRCSEESRKNLQNMDDALREFPTNSSGGSYFRGFPATASMWSQFTSLEVGDSFSDPGYGSFSRRPATAVRFAGDTRGRRIIIESRSRNIRAIEQESRIKGEQEGVLPRNISQTVRSVRREGDTLYLIVD